MGRDAAVRLLSEYSFPLKRPFRATALSFRVRVELVSTLTRYIIRQRGYSRAEVLNLATPYNLVVVTPEKIYLDGQAVITIAPGAEGELGVMAGHAALMTELVPGEVRATLADGRTTSHIVISGGFMEVTPERTTILADSAERADEIDYTRAESDLAQARALFAESAAGSPEAAQALAAVQLGEARLRAGRPSGR